MWTLKEPAVLARLSMLEKEYATNYANVVEEHFGSVLGQMPEGYGSMLQQIEEQDAAWDMVPEPNLDKHVRVGAFPNPTHTVCHDKTLTTFRVTITGVLPRETRPRGRDVGPG